MKKFAIAAFAASALLSLVASASAGTYEDNVFRRGEPRWGSSSRFHEDRNQHRMHRGGMQNHRGGHIHRGGYSHRGMQMQQGGQMQGHSQQRTVVREYRFRRLIGVRTVGAPQMQQAPRAHVACGNRCAPRGVSCRSGCNKAPTAANINNVRVNNVAHGTNNTATTNVTVNQNNFSGVTARAPATPGGPVGSTFRGKAQGSANMTGSQLTITMVTCTLSNGSSGLIAKVSATGETRCVQKR